MKGVSYEYQNADPTDPFRFEDAPERISLRASGMVEDAKVGDHISLAATYEVVDRKDDVLSLRRYREAEGAYGLVPFPEQARGGFPFLAVLIASAVIVAVGVAAIR